MLLLEAVALSWLMLEGSADGLESVIWSQSSLEVHAVNHKLWVELASEGAPIFGGISQHVIVINCVIASGEGFVDALFNNISINSQFLHQAIALLGIDSVDEKLMGTLHILEVDRLWRQVFVHLLLDEVREHGICGFAEYGVPPTLFNLGV